MSWLFSIERERLKSNFVEVFKIYPQSMVFPPKLGESKTKRNRFTVRVERFKKGPEAPSSGYEE